MNDNILLRIIDLHTYFFTNRGIVKAVEGVDLTIHAGETVGLVGESGCGKTVTALSIMKLIPPQGQMIKSQILFNGQDLLKLDDRKMQKIRGNQISMIFQEPMTSLNPVFRIGDQIAEAIRLHRKVGKSKAFLHSVEMLEKVGIPDSEKRAEEYPHQLSGGMRQRVMIAMALCCNPKLLIADEPTTALDVTIQAQILELINDLKQEIGSSVLIITHDLGVIAEMASSVAVMYTGKVVEHADTVRLFTNAKHPYTMGLINSMPKMNQPIPEDRMLYTIPKGVPNLLYLPVGCSFHERCSKTFAPCSEKTPPLFEVESGHFVRCWLYGSS
ncbi:MAG: ABC transporter ATP-binding protein [Deltaproteobacteria bacterium]|nr:ABC transporter ATP-binding protein [Deltaproteobacteria bacterium]